MLAVKFIGTNPSQQSSNATLRKFLLLNKESHAMLKRQVMKQALLYETDITRLKQKRILIWKKLLGFEQDTKDYYAFRDKVNSTN